MMPGKAGWPENWTGSRSTSSAARHCCATRTRRAVAKTELTPKSSASKVRIRRSSVPAQTVSTVMSTFWPPGLRGFRDLLRGLGGDLPRAVEAEEFSACVLGFHDTSDTKCCRKARSGPSAFQTGSCQGWQFEISGRHRSRRRSAATYVPEGRRPALPFRPCDGDIGA